MYNSVYTTNVPDKTGPPIETSKDLMRTLFVLKRLFIVHHIIVYITAGHVGSRRTAV